MSIIEVDNQNQIVLHNGVAYGAIAGGATGYIEEPYKWFVGNNATGYFGMMVSRGIEMPRILATLAIRSAMAEAVLNHAAELPHIVDANHNPPRLNLNAAERLDDAAVAALTVYARVPPAEWNAAHHTALVNNANAAAPAAGYVVDRVPAVYVVAINTPENRMFAIACARLTYSILADNGLGLITAAHHYRGQAVNAALATLKMYGMDRMIRDAGMVVKEYCGFLFHDTLHPISYERVAEWANNMPPAASAKVASTIHKRLPAYPGGVVFVQRAITVRRQLQGASNLPNTWAGINNTAADQRLVALNANILANVLDYNGIFRPAALAQNQNAIQSVVTYSVALFGIFDAWTGIVNKDIDEGPTKGPGIKKMIEENRATYQRAVAATQVELAQNQAVQPNQTWQALTA